MDRRRTGNDNSQELIITIIATCLSLSVFVVSLRFYVRLVIIRKFGPDDWALAAALVRILVSCDLPTNGLLLGRNYMWWSHNGSL